MEIFFGPLPLNVYKLEGVREIYFGIPVTKRVLSSLVGTVAMHLSARRNDTQSCNTRAAVRCRTNSIPIQAHSSGITKVTGFSTKAYVILVAQQQ